MKTPGGFCAAAGLAWTAFGEFQMPDRPRVRRGEVMGFRVIWMPENGGAE